MNLEIFKSGDEVKMSSREIAELTGKPHNDLLKAIRVMEPAWERTTGKNFLLVNYQQVTGNGTIREFPEYQLNKTECLYIATKFNDETRAKLILRWEELEKQNSKPLTQAEIILVQAQALVDMERKINSVEAKVDKIVKAQEDVMAQLEAIPLIEGEIPEQSARSKVNELVRHYSYISGISYREVWNAIYKVLLYNYGINISGIKAIKPNESKFDKAIRVGHLDTIHLVISEMIREYQSKLLNK